MRAAVRQQHAFTIIEAMVVVFILAILAAFAAPAMMDLIRTQKVRSIAYDLFADLTYARSEAIARGGNVGIGSFSGGGFPDGIDWAKGWQVRDLTTNRVLRESGAQASGVNFTASSPGLIFDRTGRNLTGNISFFIEPAEAAPDNQKRCIRIAPSGRPNSAVGPCV